MSKINTNMAGVTTLYHLRNKEEGLNKALERISSGLRLNNAVDDAAGASIVNRMTSQIKGLEAAIRNAADAISLTQTAEGAIEEVTQILHRMRELSVQSANGVYTGQDRQAIQNEVGALQEELLEEGRPDVVAEVLARGAPLREHAHPRPHNGQGEHGVHSEEGRPVAHGREQLHVVNQDRQSAV